MPNLSLALRETAAMYPDQPAVVEAVPIGELRDFVESRLAEYKYPSRVWLVDSLPKGPTGKIMRRQIVAPQEVSAK